MATQTQAVLEPRKSPVQTRSVVTVDAILKATIQVLLKVGKERLTTTLVAARAGVSVGTLYQYFPNKSALLKAVLRQHITMIAESIERVAEVQRGRPVDEVVTALVHAWLDAKMSDPKTSVALYAVSSDVDGLTVVREMSMRGRRTIVAMLESASDQLAGDVEVVASVLGGALAGVSRRLVESTHSEGELEGLRAELVVMARAYVRARAVRDWSFKQKERRNA